MARRTATLTHTPTTVTVTVSGSDEAFQFDIARDGTYVQVCGKCSGNAHIPHYAHVHGGICFDCNGRRYTREFDNDAELRRWALATVRRHEKAAIAREEKRAQRHAEAETVRAAEALEKARLWAEWSAPHDRLIAAIARHSHRSDFLARLHSSLTSNNPITDKAVAIATSIVFNFDHADADAENRGRDGFIARHIGAVGDKVDVTVRVERAQYVDGYAYNSLTRLVSGAVVGGEYDGQAVVLFSTARWACDVEAGATVTLTGATVKRHSEFRGTPQTTLGGRMKASTE